MKVSADALAPPTASPTLADITIGPVPFSGLLIDQEPRRRQTPASSARSIAAAHLVAGGGLS